MCSGTISITWWFFSFFKCLAHVPQNIFKDSWVGKQKRKNQEDIEWCGLLGFSSQVLFKSPFYLYLSDLIKNVICLWASIYLKILFINTYHRMVVRTKWEYINCTQDIEMLLNKDIKSFFPLEIANEFWEKEFSLHCVTPVKLVELIWRCCPGTQTVLSEEAGMSLWGQRLHRFLNHQKGKRQEFSPIRKNGEQTTQNSFIHCVFMPKQLLIP